MKRASEVDLTGFETRNIGRYIVEAAKHGRALTTSDFGFDGQEVTLDGKRASDRIGEITRDGGAS